MFNQSETNNKEIMFNSSDEVGQVSKMMAGHGHGPRKIENEKNSNKLKTEMIFKIGKLKTELRIKVSEILSNCENCRNNQAKKYKEFIDRKNEILDNYDFANQWFLGSFLIGPKPQMQKIVGEMENVRKGFGFPYCEKHTKEELPILKHIQVEIESLIETLELIK